MSQDTSTALSEVAAVYAGTILRTIRQEYPNYLQHVMRGPDDKPTPHELHPAFYGCYDWHSSVEMHWALIRLLRLVPDQLDMKSALDVLDRHLTESAIQRETQYMLARRSFERPYGWGWALTLAHELTRWEHEPAEKWLVNIRPLADAITGLFLDWLPRTAYPIRVGMHSNSAFGLARSVPWAKYLADQGDSRFLDSITQTAIRWYGADRDYPARFEPGGSDFLSPALTEVDLMHLLLEETFLDWLDLFLPGFWSGEPKSLFEPAHVSDPGDGQAAHLHGLNLYRAFVWKQVDEKLPLNDGRKKYLHASMEAHVRASLGSVAGSDYMVEHWLAAYAMLYLSGG